MTYFYKCGKTQKMFASTIYARYVIIFSVKLVKAVAVIEFTKPHGKVTPE